jgi:hypothetical protein
MTFCRSPEYALLPVKVLEPVLEVVAVDTGGVVTDDAELKVLLTVPIKNSRAGEDRTPYPAREVDAGRSLRPALAGFS